MSDLERERSNASATTDSLRSELAHVQEELRVVTVARDAAKVCVAGLCVFVEEVLLINA